jgi:RNA recognition motif-containing protein
MAQASLYVGNLPYSFTESKLIDLFEKYGATSARIIEGRGFGFVDIDEDKVDAAIADYDSKEIETRTISVSKARPKNDDRRSGGFKPRNNRR